MKLSAHARFTHSEEPAASDPRHMPRITVADYFRRVGPSLSLTIQQDFEYGTQRKWQLKERCSPTAADGCPWSLWDPLFFYSSTVFRQDRMCARDTTFVELSMQAYKTRWLPCKVSPGALGWMGVISVCGRERERWIHSKSLWTFYCT